MAEHMQLYVSTKSGVITLLDVAPTDTVLDVKKKLHSKGAVSARKQRLMHGSTDLQDHMELREYHIQPESTLRLRVMREDAGLRFL